MGIYDNIVDSPFRKRYHWPQEARKAKFMTMALTPPILFGILFIFPLPLPPLRCLFRLSAPFPFLAFQALKSFILI